MMEQKETKKLINLALGAYFVGWIVFAFAIQFTNGILVILTSLFTLLLNVVAMIALYRNYQISKLHIFIVELIFGVVFTAAQIILIFSTL